jgi:hypothetical protein
VRLPVPGRFVSDAQRPRGVFEPLRLEIDCSRAGRLRRSPSMRSDLAATRVGGSGPKGRRRLGPRRFAAAVRSGGADGIRDPVSGSSRSELARFRSAPPDHPVPEELAPGAGPRGAGHQTIEVEKAGSDLRAVDSMESGFDSPPSRLIQRDRKTRVGIA